MELLLPVWASGFGLAGLPQHQQCAAQASPASTLTCCWPSMCLNCCWFSSRCLVFSAPRGACCWQPWPSYCSPRAGALQLLPHLASQQVTQPLSLTQPPLLFDTVLCASADQGQDPPRRSSSQQQRRLSSTSFFPLRVVKRVLMMGPTTATPSTTSPAATLLVDIPFSRRKSSGGRAGKSLQEVCASMHKPLAARLPTP